MTFNPNWILVSFCLIFTVNLIAKQLIRERLIALLIEHRDYAVDISSDWTFWKLGYTNAIKSSAVWGIDGKAMLKIPRLRNIILAARVASVVENVCVMIFLLIFVRHLL